MTIEDIVGGDSELIRKLSDEGISNADELKERLSVPEKADELRQKLGVDSKTVEEWKGKLETEHEEEEESEVPEQKDGNGYRAHAKPALTPDLARALRVRKELSLRRPDFLRAEYYKADRLGTKWRKPRGKQGKMRLAVYYRPKLVSKGYGSPAAARHLHPSGFAERIVHNVSELEGVDPKTTAVRIAHSVGTRKRKDIIAEAERLQIRVLNG